MIDESDNEEKVTINNSDEKERIEDTKNIVQFQSMINSTENDDQRQQQSINDEEEKSQTPSQVMAHMTILNDEVTENIQKEEKYANDSVKVNKEHKSSP